MNQSAINQESDFSLIQVKDLMSEISSLKYN